MEKSYTEQQQISYFEVDNNLYLTPSALVFHLQDTAIRHSDTLGYTLDYINFCDSADDFRASGSKREYWCICDSRR